MKQLLSVAALMMVMSCGGNDSHRTEAGADMEDSTSESQRLDNATGEEVSPQLELDSADASRFEIDTVSSARGAERQSTDEALEDKR